MDRVQTRAEKREGDQKRYTMKISSMAINHPSCPVLISTGIAPASSDSRPWIKASWGSIYLFVGCDDVRFKRQVVPGDQLVLGQVCK